MRDSTPTVYFNVVQGHNLEFGGGNEKVDYAAHLEDKDYMNRPKGV
jgi:hypothetical protein